MRSSGLRTFAFVVLTFITLAGASAHAQSDKFMNVRVSPLGLIIGYLNVDVDFMVNEQLTIGPSVTYWKWSFDPSSSTEDVDVKTFAYGVRANFHPDGVFNDGWYISPYVHAVKTKADGASIAKAELSAMQFAVIAGYHWFWETFNLNLGAGYAFSNQSDLDVTYTDGERESVKSRSGGGLTADFMIGWAF